MGIQIPENDPKHTTTYNSKCAGKWFKINGVEVMSWPAQSPVLNYIENFWTDGKQEYSYFYAEIAF